MSTNVIKFRLTCIFDNYDIMYNGSFLICNLDKVFDPDDIFNILIYKYSHNVEFVFYYYLYQHY